MSDTITIVLDRRVASTALSYFTGRRLHRLNRDGAPNLAEALQHVRAALYQGLENAPAAPCPECHGSRFTRNRAWDEFWREIGEENPQIEEITPEYDRMLEPRKAAYAAEHGPELIPCPTCSDKEARRG